MQDRIDTLEQISKLPVSIYKDMLSWGGNTYFVFGESAKPFKTICTYPKAKLFAEGIALGRKLVVDDEIEQLTEKLAEKEIYIQKIEEELRQLYVESNRSEGIMNKVWTEFFGQGK